MHIGISHTAGVLQWRDAGSKEKDRLKRQVRGVVLCMKQQLGSKELCCGLGVGSQLRVCRSELADRPTGAIL